MTTFQANLLSKPQLFIPSSSSSRLSASRLVHSHSFSTFTPISLSSPKPPITLYSLNPNHDNAHFTSDSTPQKKRLARLLADADANPNDADKQSALLFELNKHSPESVIKRFEQRGHMVDDKGIVEYLRALVFTNAISEYLPDVESGKPSSLPTLLQELKQRASGSMEDLPLKDGTDDKEPLDGDTSCMDGKVDPKASKKSTIFGKEVEEILLEEWAELLKNHRIKQELEDVLEFLQNPTKFTGLGGKFPKGIILLRYLSAQVIEQLYQGKVPEVDAKASNKSTIFGKEVEEILLEAWAELLKNPGIKQELEEVLEFLQNPTKFTGLGGKFPKGIILLRYLSAQVIEQLYQGKVPEVDPKASKKSTIFGKEVEEILLEAWAELLKNPRIKQELEEVLEFLQNPTKFTGLGGKFPKGIILLRYLSAQVIEQLYQGKVPEVDPKASKNSTISGKEGVDILLEEAAELLKNPRELEEVLEFLQNPTKFTGPGGKFPKGIILLRYLSAQIIEQLYQGKVPEVDPKASKNSTISGKEGVDILLEEAAELLKNPRELEEVLEFLQNPTKFTGPGGKFPKGIILLRYLSAQIIEQLYQGKVPEVDPKASKKSTISGKEVVDILLEEAAELLKNPREREEVLEFLQNPTKFTGLGGKIPKGIILSRRLLVQVFEELYPDTQ